MTLPHILTYGVKAVITSFHMPAFFIISGILTNADKLQKTSATQYILKKGYRLLIPYIFFEIIGGLQQMLLMGTESVSFHNILYGIITIHCHVGADWFLPTMFFAELGLFFLIRVCNKKYFPLVSAVCFLIAFILTDVNYFVACFRRILTALTFIMVGFSFKKLFIKKNLFAGIISGPSTILCAYLNGVVDLATRQFGNPFLYIVGSLIGTYFVLCISQYICGVLAKILKRIGRSSLTIMGTHQNVQVAINVFYGSVYPFPLQIIVCLMTLVYELLIVNLYENLVPFLVGQPITSKYTRRTKKDTLT